MWPIVTDWIVWSDSQSVGLSVTVVSPAVLAEPVELQLGCELSWAHVSMYYLRVQISHVNGQFWGEKEAAIVKYRDFVPRAVQKQLNCLRCRLGCGLGWAQESMYWRVHIGNVLRVWLNRPRPYVKLVWPCVIIVAIVLLLLSPQYLCAMSFLVILVVSRMYVDCNITITCRDIYFMLILNTFL